MSIDDKFERLERERRLKERVTNVESPKMKQRDRETFLRINKLYIEDAEQKLNNCTDEQFEFIYDKFNPCNDCTTRPDKTRYLAENCPKRICDNIGNYKQEFYRKSKQKETPPNHVVGWGVDHYGNDIFGRSIFNSPNRYETNTTTNENKVTNPVKTANNITKPVKTEKKTSKPVETKKRPRPNKVKEIPKIDPVEWTEKLNALEDDVFNFIILQLGVPKRLKKEEQIDFIINNSKPDRIDYAIINAKKFIP